MSKSLGLSRFRRDRPDPESMSLTEHIAELRRRVVVCLVVYALTSTLGWIFYHSILDWLRDPYCHVAHPCSFYVTSPLQGLSLRVKISAYSGLILAAPVIAWELWRFITPGLRRAEKRYAVPFMAVSIALFASGAFIAYVSFPHALVFLRNVGGANQLTTIYSPSSYLSLILTLMGLFGASFEFPVLLVALQLAGVVTPAKLSSWRRQAIVLILVAAAVFTPSGDPFSMFALAIPLYVFYEGSIGVGWLVARRRRATTVEADNAGGSEPNVARGGDEVTVG